MARFEFFLFRILEVDRRLRSVDQDVRRKRATIKILEGFACRKAAARLRVLLGDMEMVQTSLATERVQLIQYLNQSFVPDGQMQHASEEGRGPQDSNPVRQKSLAVLEVQIAHADVFVAWDQAQVHSRWFWGLSSAAAEERLRLQRHVRANLVASRDSLCGALGRQQGVGASLA